MLRSQIHRKKRQPQSELWCYKLRLKPELEKPLRDMAEQRGSTIRDEIELAVEAHIKAGVPSRHLPEERSVITSWDVVMMKMMKTNGANWRYIADTYGIPVWKAMRYCQK